jgi:hypothetical protein
MIETFPGTMLAETLYRVPVVCIPGNNPYETKQ